MTSCALGLCLFTFITKLRICDNAHPLSRNSSSDVNVDSMTCCSYHLRKSAYRYISMFLVFILLISRLLFVANLLNAMFTFTVSFYSVLHMLEHYFSPKTAATQYNPHWPRRPSIYDFQTRHQSLAIADERSFVATRVRHSRSRHDGLFVQRRGTDVLHDKVLRTARCRLLYRCSHATNTPSE